MQRGFMAKKGKLKTTWGTSTTPPFAAFGEDMQIIFALLIQPKVKITPIKISTMRDNSLRTIIGPDISNIS